MTNKIKLFFIFLAVTAVFSVLSLADVFRGVKSEKFSSPAGSVLSAPEEDVDHDGLSNSDESYWNTDFQNPDTDGDGFLDGEEVASRHNPTEPGPNDALADLNLTEKMAHLAVAGLAEGSLKPDSKNYEDSLDLLTFSIIDDGIRSLTPADPPKLNIVDSSKDNQQKYIFQAETIWELFLTAFGEEIKNLEFKLQLMNTGGLANKEFVIYFNVKSKEFQDIANQLTNGAVPQNWINEHTAFFRLLSQMTELNKALAQGEADSIKATMAFGLLINVVDEFPLLIKSYVEKMTSEGLTGKLIFKSD